MLHDILSAHALSTRRRQSHEGPCAVVPPLSLIRHCSNGRDLLGCARISRRPRPKTPESSRGRSSNAACAAGLRTLRTPRAAQQSGFSAEISLRERACRRCSCGMPLILTRPHFSFSRRLDPCAQNKITRRHGRPGRSDSIPARRTKPFDVTDVRAGRTRFPARGS
jgi:hypothetical protein